MCNFLKLFPESGKQTVISINFVVKLVMSIFFSETIMSNLELGEQHMEIQPSTVPINAKYSHFCSHFSIFMLL